MEAKDITIGGRAVKRITLGGELLWEKTPREYEEVEYIVGGEVAYIRLPYTPNNRTEVNCQFMALSMLNSGCYFFCRGKTFDTEMFRVSLWKGQMSFSYNNAVFSPRFGDDTLNKIFKISNTLIESEGIMLVLIETDGNVIQKTFSDISSFSTEGDLTIFESYCQNWVSKTYGYSRCYYFTIRERGKVLMDLRPVRRMADGEYGFYDLVSNNFYGKSDTGEITGGPTTGKYY